MADHPPPRHSLCLEYRGAYLRDDLVILLQHSPTILGGEDADIYILGAAITWKYAFVYATSAFGSLVALVGVWKRWRGRPGVALLALGWASFWVLMAVGLVESFSCSCLDRIVFSRSTGQAIDLSFYLQAAAAMTYWMIVQARELGSNRASSPAADGCDAGE